MKGIKEIRASFINKREEPKSNIQENTNNEIPIKDSRNIRRFEI